MKLGRYQGTELGDRIIGAEMAMIPKAGCAVFSEALPIAVTGVIDNLGITVSNTSFLPGKEKLNGLLTTCTLDSTIE